METLRKLFGGGDKAKPAPVDPAVTPATVGDRIEPVNPRVLMVVHNPPLATQGGKRMTEHFRWHDPKALADGYIADLRKASGGYLDYRIVERVDADWFPPKEDGFSYDEATFLTAWSTHKEPNKARIDYPAQLKQFDVPRRVADDEIDEVWFFSFPYAGDYESTMAGPGAFWCNSPPVPKMEGLRKRIVVMGFNYERGVDCMLENFGHRTESIMKKAYERHPKEKNMWDRYTRHEKTNPGESEVGTVHFAPNSEKDYDWGNKRPVTAFCDDWLTYPTLPGNARTVTCEEWGNGDQRLHHLWWLNHLPKVGGKTDGISNNWWEYVVDPNKV